MNTNYELLSKNLIDHLCETVGVIETIKTLLYMGWDYDTLRDLGFDIENIEQASYEELHNI